MPDQISLLLPPVAHRSRGLSRFTPLLLVLIVSACAEGPTTPAPGDVLMNKAAATPDSPVEDWLKAVRQKTSRYHSMTQAMMAGYVADPFCVQSPAGGMGFHWPNVALFDAIFEPLRPEVLLYAPADNGKLRLVAIEYVVIDVGQPRPHFADHPFDIGGVPPLTMQGIPHWSLHVWLYEKNPNGVFTKFNPNVSC